MKKQIGIWLDTKKAVIITLSSGEKTVKTLVSEIDRYEKIDGESDQKGRFGTQFIDQKKNKENRLREKTRQFCEEIIEEVCDCDALVLFGPAQMKFDLEKEIRNQTSPLSEKLKDVVVADSMTENQMAAWVINYFD